MKVPVCFKDPLHVLGGAAALGAVAMIIVSLPPGGTVESSASVSPSQIEAPDADRLNERIPDVGTVLEKHLFVPSREATGQNSFPDLVVKGVFIGEEKSAIFSLKSKPQVNLRVWLGEVETTLNSVTDPRDPRQPLVTFLREWPIKEISHDSVTVEHFITGEVETYDVDYVAAKKVKDDAARGYGQGIMPQGGGTVAKGSANQKKVPANAQRGGAPRTPNPTSGAQFMADRVSSMLQRLDPQQKKQFLQRLNQQNGGGKPQNNSKNQNSKNSKKSSKKNSRK